MDSGTLRVVLPPVACPDIDSPDALRVLLSVSPIPAPTTAIMLEHRPARTDSLASQFEFEAKGGAALKAYREGGDVDFDSAPSRAERATIRRRTLPAFRLAAKRFFATVCIADSDRMSKAVYVNLHVRISRCLAPDLNAREARRCASDEWHLSTRSAHGIDLDQFAGSLFSLADLWTSTISEEKYISFMQKLFKRITCDKKQEMHSRRHSLPTTVKARLIERQRSRSVSSVAVSATRSSAKLFSEAHAAELSFTRPRTSSTPSRVGRETGTASLTLEQGRATSDGERQGPVGPNSPLHYNAVHSCSHSADEDAQATVELLAPREALRLRRSLYDSPTSSRPASSSVASPLRLYARAVPGGSALKPRRSLQMGLLRFDRSPLAGVSARART
ncbi:hypothetical protein T492DRAFT_839588 [Pavlovales sp. CCMP2436]|nr:hypothetical protein T492DRAFT_839588 [Pavlovales sp. CCMP2436]